MARQAFRVKTPVLGRAEELGPLWSKQAGFHNREVAPGTSCAMLMAPVPGGKGRVVWRGVTFARWLVETRPSSLGCWY